MADPPEDVTPTRRILPSRHRRESSNRHEMGSSSKQETLGKDDNETLTDSRSTTRKHAAKRIKVSHVSTPTRSTSTPVSSAEDILPTKLKTVKQLPSLAQPQGSEVLSQRYQSAADSAIVAASLHRSRMQWLCDGVFRKYWTKPTKKKNAPAEPADNPDLKSMQRLGNATITVEPHTFDATFYVVREKQIPPVLSSKPSALPPAKPIQPAVGPPNSNSASQPAVHVPSTTNLPSHPATTAKASPGPARPTQTQVPTRPVTPPGGAKATDPVIQMLANRAATDPHLKELMKVVAQSRASTDQLRQFQAHIDEFNATIKQQAALKEAQSKSSLTTQPATQPAQVRSIQSGTHRASLLSPAQPLTPQAAYSSQQRPEPLVKHVVLELTAVPASGQPPNPDRWLFPEYAVLDTQYGGTEMTCSFFAERKGSDLAAQSKDSASEDSQPTTATWASEKTYYEPVTMVVNAANSRIIATIASAAKSLPQVQEYMRTVMQNQTRAPREYLAYHLPKAKGDADFIDSAVELSEADELQSSYPV